MDIKSIAAAVVSRAAKPHLQDLIKLHVLTAVRYAHAILDFEQDVEQFTYQGVDLPQTTPFSVPYPARFRKLVALVGYNGTKVETYKKISTKDALVAAQEYGTYWTVGTKLSVCNEMQLASLVVSYYAFPELTYGTDDGSVLPSETWLTASEAGNNACICFALYLLYTDLQLMQEANAALQQAQFFFNQIIASHSSIEDNRDIRD